MISKINMMRSIIYMRTIIARSFIILIEIVMNRRVVPIQVSVTKGSIRVFNANKNRTLACIIPL